MTNSAGTNIDFNNNPAVTFVPQAPGSPNLLAVATHEIGHALGLLHNTNPASVMYPFNPANETLSPDDIAAVRALYGWAPQTPLSGIGTSAGPALCACGSVLLLAWRGIDDDHNIWYAVSTDGRNWSPQRVVPGAASSDGPSLAWDGRQAWMVWKGVPEDQGLYFATWDLVNNWSNVSPIDGTGSSCGPSIAIAAVSGGSVPILVWKGIAGDAGIYFSTFSGGSWGSQNKVGGVGTSDRPAVAADPVTGVPRMVWKGIEGDHALYTSTLRGLFWQPQESVAWVIAGNAGDGTVAVGRPGSELGPGIVTAGGKLLMVWRGVEDDQELWFTQVTPDSGVGGQTIAEWSTQAKVGGYASSSRPAIATFQGNIYVAWKGIAGDHNIFTTFA